MSKKKNKKKNHRYYYEYDYDVRKNKNKKKNHNKVEYDDRPHMKRIKLSLDNREIKKNRKILTEPVEVPKIFRQHRAKCNHADGIISVAEYKAITPTYAVYTPALERVCRHYGEENVSICKACYDALVNIENITINDIDAALAILYSAANAALYTNRMSNDEIREINKLKDDLTKWDQIIDLIGKAKDLNIEYNSKKNTDSISKLNNITGLQ